QKGGACSALLWIPLGHAAAPTCRRLRLSWGTAASHGGSARHHPTCGGRAAAAPSDATLAPRRSPHRPKVGALRRWCRPRLALAASERSVRPRRSPHVTSRDLFRQQRSRATPKRTA